MIETAEPSRGTAHVVQRMAPGGIETLVLDLVADRPDDRILSLCGDVDTLVAQWPRLAPFRGQLVAFDTPGGIRPALVGEVRTALRALRPAAVVLHHAGPLIYGGLAARRAGVQRIIHVEHDAWHYANPRRRLLTRLVERAVRPRHVAVSAHTARELQRVLPFARIGVIRNGVDLERFAAGDRTQARIDLALDSAARIVGTAGRLVPVKGHDVLIRAASRLPDDIQVVIAGDGPERARLEALASELGIRGRIHFLGHRDDVASLLPAFDVFCLPSHQEGFPRTAVEAQAAGIPVVASAVGGLVEAVCPETGRLVPPGAPHALSRTLLEALGRQPVRSPRDFVERTLSWQRTVSSYRALMEDRHAA